MTWRLELLSGRGTLKYPSISIVILILVGIFVLVRSTFVENVTTDVA